MTNWDKRYLDLAEHVASWSKDPSKKIGAVAVGNGGQILSIGYNGFPRGIQDTEERLNDRETKYSLVVHAEMNAIYNATHNGISLNGATLYVYGLPVCSDCAKGVIQVGIKRIVMNENDSIHSTWLESWERSRAMFNEAGIEYTFL